MEDRFVGSMLGLALGDALGSAHEGGPPGQGLLIRRDGNLRWTDDTQMAMGLAESLVENRGLDPDHLARRWADKYEPRRGYAGGARRLLEMIREGADWRKANRAIFPDGSFGNGAAMRAAPLGLFFHGRPDELRSAAELAGSITHAHPLGIEGGVLIACATAMALDGPLDLKALHDSCTLDEFRDGLRAACKDLTPDEVRRKLGNGVEAHRSAVTAVFAASRAKDFLPMLEFIISLGGDVDTIGAMAGGIFGARHGVAALPGDVLARLEARDDIERLARGLHEARR